MVIHGNNGERGVGGGEVVSFVLCESSRSLNYLSEMES